MKLNKLIKSVIVTISLTLGFFAQASQSTQVVPYYGDEFYSDLRSGVANEALEERLKSVLRSYHVARASENDLIVKDCQGQGTCYGHKAIGYGAARVFLMGKYYLIKNGESGYGVRDVYCDKVRPNTDFKGQAPAPGVVPDNRVINVEHTWPQSHFTRRFSEDSQKSDLHHLFPTDTKINAIRGNNPFGEVSTDLVEFRCKGPRFGLGSAGPDEVFEPPQDHKGNVARALFYFAVRYDMNIDSRQEVILRKWHREDPVDDEEMKRNDEIFKAQGNRNPFIDFPELVDKISDI